MDKNKVKIIVAIIAAAGIIISTLISGIFEMFNKQETDDKDIYNINININENKN